MIDSLSPLFSMPSSVSPEHFLAMLPKALQ
jgi:hypothetical protein